MAGSHNLHDYEAAVEALSWADIYDEFDRDAPEEVNIAHEVCDRHAQDRGAVALYQVSDVQLRWCFPVELAVDVLPRQLFDGLVVVAKIVSL